MSDIDRAIQSAEPESCPHCGEDIENCRCSRRIAKAHVSGSLINGLQRCTRCGCIMHDVAREGAGSWEVGRTVYSFGHGNWSVGLRGLDTAIACKGRGK